MKRLWSFIVICPMGAVWAQEPQTPVTAPVPASAAVAAAAPTEPAAAPTIVSVASVRAADGAGGGWTIEQAMQQAMMSFPAVEARRKERDAANSSLDSAQWQRYPGMSIQSQAAEQGGVVNTIRLEQPLWSAGRVTAGIDAAKARLEAADNGLREAEQNAMLRTGAAFVELLRMKERIAAADESIDEHRRLLELIQRRAGTQVSSQAEVTAARARLEQARAERIQFITQAANARADLEQVTGRKINSLSKPQPRPEPAPDLQTAVQMALDSSPLIKRLTFERNASEADQQVKRGAFLPQVVARYERHWGGNFPRDTAYVGFSFQPGNGLSAASSLKEGQLRIEALDASLATSQKDLGDQIRQYWNTWQASLAESPVLEDQVAATRGVYESFVRQFPAGRKTWQEVLNARREATQARYAQADSQWNGYLAALRIDVATMKMANVKLLPPPETP